MKIAIHIGAHLTDGERLIKSALKDAGPLAAAGIVVPSPGTYRKPVREAIQTWAGGGSIADEGRALLSDIAGAGTVRQLVLSNGALLCTPAKVFEGGSFYALAGMKVQALCDMFPGHDIEIHIATRNPATFIPAVWAQTKAPTLEDFLGGCNPRTVRWSELIGRIRAAAPGVPVVAWCNEDTPLIWGRLLRRLTGAAPDMPLTGEHDLLQTILSEDGFARFLAYLRSHPPASEAQMGRVIAAFLGKYALEDEIEEDVDAPGWDEAMIDALTNAYEVDLARIALLDGVRYVAP